VVKQRVAFPPEPEDKKSPLPPSDNILEPDDKGQLSFTGLVFSPDGRTIYLSNVNGSIKLFSVAEDGMVAPARSFGLPPAYAPRRDEEIPAGLALSQDGKRLYVALNLSNRLAEIDTDNGRLLRVFETGALPFDVVLAGGRAYVSNWGGPRPVPGTSPARPVKGPWSRSTGGRARPTGARFRSSTLRAARRSRDPGPAPFLGPRPLPRQAIPRCANAASDNLSVIDVRSGRVVETIWVKPDPAEVFGASPNALAFDPKGEKLYVANGTQNAVAVIRFDPRKAKSALLGLIPRDGSPAPWPSIPSSTSCASGTSRASRPSRHGAEDGRQRVQLAPVSRFGLPHPPAGGVRAAEDECGGLGELSPGKDRPTFAPARPGEKPRPVPERIGEPSVFKHVIYVIKENRTYDQVLGDDPRGDGDPRLTIFGRTSRRTSTRWSATSSSWIIFTAAAS